MNPFVTIMAVFAALGLTDKILGGKLALADEFDKGLAASGGLALSTVGFYCIGITAVEQNSAAIAALSAHLPFDPSVIVGCLLAPDMGGLPLAQKIAASPLVGVFSGAFLCGGIGMTVCYQLPVFLGAIPREDRSDLMRGFVFGFLGLPVGLIPAGLLLGLSAGTLLRSILPVLILCAALGLAYSFAPDGTVRVLKGFGSVVSVLSWVLFALAVSVLFFDTHFTDTALIEEIMGLILRMVLVAAGGLVLSKVLLAAFPKLLWQIAEKLGVNREAVIGLLLSCTQSLAMLPLFSKMDRRGKIANAAFSVGGAYLTGGQLAFVSSLVSGRQATLYVLSKALAGTAGVCLALALTKKDDREGETG